MLRAPDKTTLLPSDSAAWINSSFSGSMAHGSIYKDLGVQSSSKLTMQASLILNKPETTFLSYSCKICWEREV